MNGTGKTTPSPAVVLRALCASVVLFVGCGWWTEHRLVGQWKTEATPERTLDLYRDGSYSLRLSGKGLGFVSDILGPEKGAWRVEGEGLMLAYRDADGVERSRKLPINSLAADEVVLAGDRWWRVPGH